jgi:hypothetical protein
MPEFLVELYVSQADASSAAPATELARQAAEALSAQGAAIRYVRSIYVPDDETCFHLYRAGSVDAVREAACRAGLPVERISQAVPTRTRRRPENTPRTPGATR